MYDINLYPPIFDQSYMPAFVIGNACNVYFSLSDLNTLDDLYHINNTYGAIQVTVKKQQNNANALASKYINEIMLADLHKQNDGQYFIQITNNDIQGGFVANQYYKVQIRFTSNQASAPQSAISPAFSSWLSNNIEYFSQWSTVVLVRGIHQPTASLNVNGKALTNSGSTIYLDSDFIEISGSISFNQQDNERLENYRIRISGNGVVQEDTGEIYVSNNQIYYVIQASLQIGETYGILIEYTTNNLYSNEVNGFIQIRSITPMQSNMELSAQENSKAGYIKLILKRNTDFPDPDAYNIYFFSEEDDDTVALVSHETVSQKRTYVRTDDTMQYSHVKFDPYWNRMLFKDEYNQSFLNLNDKIIIRRSSSRSDFKKWITLTEFEINETNIVNLYWYDYSVEPGVWYKYQVIRYSPSAERRTAELRTDEDKPLMIDSEDIFLNSKGKELIVKFDPSISNFSNKVAESVTETIGSKYPYIRRNGNVDYKTFSLSGTISFFMDTENNMMAASRQEVFGDSINFYNQYNEQKQIDAYNDYIHQKFFREKVMQFLQNNDTKLFRSLTEGNVLVKLNNVTFTPNETLGRLIYSFSCTAYEIAESNEINYNKYKILENNIKTITKEDIEAE